MQAAETLTWESLAIDAQTSMPGRISSQRRTCCANDEIMMQADVPGSCMRSLILDSDWRMVVSQERIVLPEGEVNGG